MFKGDYKRHYDQIHPSQELIERTKKLALEQCHLKQEENTEEYKKNRIEEEIVFEQPEEQKMEEKGKVILFGTSKKKIYQVSMGLAASVAVIVTGFLISGNLKEQQDQTPMVAVASEEPMEEEEHKIFPTAKAEKSTVEEKENKKENKKEKNDTKKMSVSQMAGYNRREMAQLDYASNNRVILHGNFGILVYDLSSAQIIAQISPEQYMSQGALVSEIITVSHDGNYIEWYNAVSSTGEAKIYNVSTGELASKKMLQTEEEMETAFFGLQEVAGTEADVYVDSCINGDMVSLGNGRYCQLVYQAPGNPLQASLGISIIDINQKQEQIYPVFGSIGEQLVRNQGMEYGNYYNIRGQQLFGSNEETIETVVPNVSTTPEITEAPNTEIPEETVCVEITPEVTISFTEVPITEPEVTIVEESE